jgi:hypothetical protein
MRYAAALVSIGLLACSRAPASTSSSEPVDDASALTIATASAPPEPAAPPHSCKEEWDCPRPPPGSCASVRCARHYDEHGKESTRTCITLTPGGGVGTPGCLADTTRNVTSYYFASSATPDHGVICDIDGKGAYCDKTTNVCTKNKAIGEACDASRQECGKEGECVNGKCAPAVSVGASCKDRRCVSTAKCDDKTKTCIARKALGVKCEMHDECASLWCDSNKCVPHPDQAKTCL